MPVLDVNADFTTGIFVTEQNSILNVNGAKLTTGCCNFEWKH